MLLSSEYGTSLTCALAESEAVRERLQTSSPEGCAGQGVYPSACGVDITERLLLQAAKVLRDPEAFDSVAELSEEEKEALEREKRTTFWRQPRELKIVIITLCVAAVVQGMRSISNGASDLVDPLTLLSPCC
jgi:hypothetical protein